jgi:short-subunit dehydrogenase
MKEKYGPWALIAGGSEGIGEKFARYLAADGINLVLLARRAEPLEELARSVIAETGVEVRIITADLTKPDMLDLVRAQTDDLEVGMLIYNAGVDNRASDFVDRSLRGLRWSIDLTVIGQTLLAHHFGALMRSRGRGGIILVGSLLDYAGGGGMSVYAAAKAYSHTLAKGLWYELKPHGVDVLGLVVSATKTPAYQKFGMPDKSADGRILASDPALVAREGLEHLGREPLWVVSEAQDMANLLLRLSPAEAVALVSNSAAAMQGR